MSSAEDKLEDAKEAIAALRSVCTEAQLRQAYYIVARAFMLRCQADWKEDPERFKLHGPKRPVAYDFIAAKDLDS